MKPFLADLKKDSSLTVFISRHDRKRLDAVAAQVNVTRSEVVRQLLATGLDQAERELSENPQSAAR